MSEVEEYFGNLNRARRALLPVAGALVIAALLALVAIPLGIALGFLLVIVVYRIPLW